jgi:hypothetical protein
MNELRNLSLHYFRLGDMCLTTPGYRDDGPRIGHDCEERQLNIIDEYLTWKYDKYFLFTDAHLYHYLFIILHDKKHNIRLLL